MSSSSSEAALVSALTPRQRGAAPGLSPEPHVIDALLVEDVLALERVALGVRRELVPANPADGLWHSGARRD